VTARRGVKARLGTPHLRAGRPVQSQLPRLDVKIDAHPIWPAFARQPRSPAFAGRLLVFRPNAVSKGAVQKLTHPSSDEINHLTKIGILDDVGSIAGMEGHDQASNAVGQTGETSRNERESGPGAA
jgi:hypothetical protein